MKKILEWIMQNKVVISGFVSALLALLVAIFCVSCGTTRATIKTSADNTASTITITTNNPTSVSLSNSVDSTKFQFKK